MNQREIERATARMHKLEAARADLDRAQAAFEKAVLAAYDKPGPYTAEQVALFAGWKRARLYQFLRNRRPEAA